MTAIQKYDNGTYGFLFMGNLICKGTYDECVKARETFLYQDCFVLPGY